MSESSQDLRRRWVVAGIRLAGEPSAQVECPTCGHQYLDVEDVPAGDRDDTISRYLRCPKCGAVEVLDRLRRNRDASA